MAIRVHSGALHGVDAVPIEVEVDLLRRLPSVCFVGLAQSAVKESADRVRSAITSAGLDFPRMRVVVNLAPADVRKEGTAFDLPVALGILTADGGLPEARLRDVLAVGELSLGGQLRPIRGALALALLARAEGKTLLLPETSAQQAALVPGVDVRGATSLAQVVAWLRGELELDTPELLGHEPVPADVDLSEVRGQVVARRALEVAAAGAHHTLLMGPPGCGKSMLARRVPTILPPLTPEESLEVSRVYSAAGLLDGRLLTCRPFRAPHHSVTSAGLVGDQRLRPGEASLAHHGVLFLDEATEFSRSVLDQLRAPLEDGRVRLTRARGSVEYPARFTLVMAANPCLCGKRGTNRPCTCTAIEVERYQRRLSGPILDRIDLHVNLEAVPAVDLLSPEPAESSAAVRERVVGARARQQERQGVPNGALSARELWEHARPTVAAGSFLLQSARLHGLSGRATTRVLKVARTLADLAGTEQIVEDHIAEALFFRTREELS